jgi:alpha/beta superfamily hydrolase
MYNNVVMAAWDTAIQSGCSALRFNFRGVGSSGGKFDNGIGEVSDLSAAVNFVGRPVFVIGYSFGAWVASRFLQDTDVPCILISPPTAMFPFPDLKRFNVWSVVGSRDQFCNQPSLLNVLGDDRLILVNGVDHFWFGDEDQLMLYLKKKIELIRSTLH